MRNSCPNRDLKIVSEEREIISILSAAIASESVISVAVASNSTEAAVKKWRTLQNAPGTAKTIRLARRVRKIKLAIYELIEAGDLNSNRDRLFRVLFDALLELTHSEDEVTATRAKRALREFQELSVAT